MNHLSHKLKILRFPDPFLRTKGREIKHVSPKLQDLGRGMLQLMYASQGVGLSAIQVGKALALLTADTRMQWDSPYYAPEKEKSAPNPAPSDGERPPYSRQNLSCRLESQIAQPLILFNPVIVEKKGKTVFQEGCLSFPSYYAEVERAEIVTVQALNIDGKQVSVHTDGLLSICLQHEIDHLHGKLFIDRLSAAKARRLRAEIEKYGWPDSPARQRKESAV